jgi:hypothetical protein
MAEMSLGRVALVMVVGVIDRRNQCQIHAPSLGQRDV